MSENRFDAVFADKKKTPQNVTSRSPSDTTALLQETQNHEGLGSAGEAAAALNSFQKKHWSEANIKVYQEWLLQTNRSANALTAKIWYEQEHETRDKNGLVNRLLDVFNKGKERRAG